jgi:hypothetical protein
MKIPVIFGENNGVHTVQQRIRGFVFATLKRKVDNGSGFDLVGIFGIHDCKTVEKLMANVRRYIEEFAQGGHRRSFAETTGTGYKVDFVTIPDEVPYY